MELIPAPVRCTGLSLAYNASVRWFGGTTPLIATWLIAQTGDPISPAYWVALASAVSLLAAILMRETRPETKGEPLPTGRAGVIVLRKERDLER